MSIISPSDTTLPGPDLKTAHNVPPMNCRGNYRGALSWRHRFITSIIVEEARICQRSTATAILFRGGHAGGGGGGVGAGLTTVAFTVCIFSMAEVWLLLLTNYGYRNL